MEKWLKTENRPVIDVVNLIAGIALVLSPGISALRLKPMQLGTPGSPVR